MNLKDELTNFVTGLSEEEAVTFFERRITTIRTWVKSGHYPMEAIERFLNLKSKDQAPSDKPEIEVLPQPEVTADDQFKFNVMTALTSFNQRISEMEQYLMKYGSTMGAPTAPRMPVVPDKPWYEPDPTEQSFQSFVNPGATVPTKGQFNIPVAGVQGHPVPTVGRSNSASAIWLKPATPVK